MSRQISPQLHLALSFSLADSERRLDYAKLRGGPVFAKPGEAQHKAMRRLLTVARRRPRERRIYPPPPNYNSDSVRSYVMWFWLTNGLGSLEQVERFFRPLPQGRIVQYKPEPTVTFELVMD